MYRRRSGHYEVFLVHPGGPYWRKKDAGAWSIPKGEVDPDEDFRTAALREFEEETGLTPPDKLVSLGSVTQKAGKVVHAFAGEGDADPEAIESNTFSMEWPPRSGRTIDVPEIDRADWFDLDTARVKINPAQAAFLDALEKLVNPPPGPS